VNECIGDRFCRPYLTQSGLYHLNPALKRWAIIKIENEIGRSYRALARERKGHDYWFWIGTHGDYNNFDL